MTQQDTDSPANALRRLEAASFGELLATVERMGANKGDRQVIALYRTWIALQGTGARQLHAAWFNLGAEWNLAGDLDNAIVAYRTALALKPGFAPAAINLGLLLERRGDPAAALSTWQEALQPDDARVALTNQKARLLEQLGQLPDAQLDAWLDHLEPKVMTEFTVTDKKALREEILHVRAQGYAVTAQEMRRGFHAVAVPLKRYDGATIAALCVAAWVEDSPVDSFAEKYLAALRDEATALQPQLL